MSDQPDPAEALTEEFDYIEAEPPPPRAALPAGEDQVQLDQEQLDERARWEEQAVEEHLKIAGSALHELIGKAESDWEMSARDLERMTAPLTRILNRYEPTARLAIASDPILLGYGTFMYSYRSILQARAAVAEEREAAEAHDGDVAGYVRVVPGSAPSNGSALRFPEAARGAPDEGE
jgi:hypothetical protein